MKTLFYIFIFALTLSTATAQKIDLKDSIITCKGVAGLKLGMTFNDILKQNPDFSFIKKGTGYGIDGEGKGLLVAYLKDTLFFLFDKKGSLDTLGGIVILYPKFATKNGIKIGTTIKEINSKYDSLTIGHSFDYTSFESISPKDLECGEINKDRDASLVMFEFFQQNVGIFDEAFQSTTTKFNNWKAKIDYISIYLWN